MSKRSKKTDDLIIEPTSDLFTASLWSAPKNEPILRDFVNATLLDSGQPAIRQVKVLNPFSVKEFAADRQLVLDVRAQDERDRWYNLEVQTASHAAFLERTVLHWAEMFSSQLRIGDKFAELLPVIGIVLTAFPIFPQLQRIHAVFRMTAEENPKVVLTDHFQMHFLRLGDLIKRQMKGVGELHGGLQGWMNFFTFGRTATEDKMAQLADNNPVVMAAYEEFQRFSSDAKMRDLERRRRQFLDDQRLSVSAAVKEGKYEEKFGIARNMKNEGFDTAVIIKMTGLPLAEIERLD